MEIIKPPIQTPDIVSSTPSQRDKPTQVPIATTQTGQTALVVFAQKNPEIINPINKFFFASIISQFHF